LIAALSGTGGGSGGIGGQRGNSVVIMRPLSLGRHEADFALVARRHK
jgi:hypothetical protein